VSKWECSKNWFKRRLGAELSWLGQCRKFGKEINDPSVVLAPLASRTAVNKDPVEQEKWKALMYGLTP